MKWPKFYLAAILLHLVVLYFVALPPAPLQEKKHYVEVTLEVLPPPTPPPSEVSLLDTPELGLAPGPQSDTPSPAASVVAPTMAPETQGSDASVPVADRLGPTTPGAKDGTGQGTGGGGVPIHTAKFHGRTFELIAVPGGINWYDAKAAAEARGGYLAITLEEPPRDNMGQLPQSRNLAPFRLVDEDRDFFSSFILRDPVYWRVYTGWQDNPFLGRNDLGPWDGKDLPEGCFLVGPWLSNYGAQDASRSTPRASDSGPNSDRESYVIDISLPFRTFGIVGPVRNFGHRFLERTALANSYLVEYNGDPPGAGK